METWDFFVFQTADDAKNIVLEVTRSIFQGDNVYSVLLWSDIVTSLFFYANIIHKNIEAEIYELLRIF